MKYIKNITLMFIFVYTLFILIEPFKANYNSQLLNKYIMSGYKKTEFNIKENKYIDTNIVDYLSVIKNEEIVETKFLFIIFFGLSIILFRYVLLVRAEERKYVKYKK